MIKPIGSGISLLVFSLACAYAWGGNGVTANYDGSHLPDLSVSAVNITLMGINGLPSSSSIEQTDIGSGWFKVKIDSGYSHLVKPDNDSKIKGQGQLAFCGEVLGCEDYTRDGLEMTCKTDSGKKIPLNGSLIAAAKDYQIDLESLSSRVKVEVCGAGVKTNKALGVVFENNPKLSLSYDCQIAGHRFASPCTEIFVDANGAECYLQRSFKGRLEFRTKSEYLAAALRDHFGGSKSVPLTTIIANRDCSHAGRSMILSSFEDLRRASRPVNPVIQVSDAAAAGSR